MAIQAPTEGTIIEHDDQPVILMYREGAPDPETGRVSLVAEPIYVGYTLQEWNTEDAPTYELTTDEAAQATVLGNAYESNPDAEYGKCTYCDQACANKIIPHVDDDDAWAELAAQHTAQCDWLTTRAHRR